LLGLNVDSTEEGSDEVGSTAAGRGVVELDHC
jgi:hypothetical protein